MNQLKIYAKAFAAAFVGVVINSVIGFLNGQAIPATGVEWVQFLITSFAPAVAVALAPAKISDHQIAVDPTVVRVTPPPVPVKPAVAPSSAPAGTWKSPW